MASMLDSHSHAIIARIDTQRVSNTSALKHIRICTETGGGVVSKATRCLKMSGGGYRQPPPGSYHLHARTIAKSMEHGEGNVREKDTRGGG